MIIVLGRNNAANTLINNIVRREALSPELVTGEKD